MNNRLMLRSQTQLLADVRARVRDTGSNRWTDAEIYMVLSDVLMTWADRVSIPHVYTITDGWVTGQSEYTLPSYIHGDITPQQRRHTDSYLYQFQVPTDQDQWVDVLNFTVQPNTSGGLTLHWGRAPDAGDGRIIWWGRNGRLPLSVPTLAEDITSSSTTIIVTTTEDIPDVGYVRIGNEWMGYAGVTRGFTNATSLNNVTRAVHSSTATNHSSAAAVSWGVAVHREDLYTQLYNATRSGLHALFITAAAESERAHHERMTMFYDDQANNFWRGYIPNKPTKLKFDRRTTGDLGGDNVYQVTI